MSTNQNVWDQIATQTAERVEDQLFEAHRGIIQSRHAGVLAAFGNDAYTEDVRTQREVEAARECIRAGGGDVLGFGTAADGYSWALLYRADNLSPSRVLDAMWDAWSPESKADDPESQGFRAIQSIIAMGPMMDDLLDALSPNIIHPN
jgi:hypothetical protein